MTGLATRSHDLELMDDLLCRGEVVDQSLHELDVINRWLGGNQVTIDGVSELLSKAEKDKPVLIADIGCGSGDMVMRIARWGAKAGRKLKVIGIDANPNIVEYARRKCHGHDNVSFDVMNVLDQSFALHKFDIVVATLFMHHFTNDQLIRLFRSLNEQTRIGFVVNDIHRHPIALHSIRMLTSLFSRSEMVKHDGPLSVRRAFKRSELKAILSKAGITNYSLGWRWAFRWKLIVWSTS
jgi:2-polyprenyl-3-methyl-5-hydroxy-6-metoxy-1,4-benzoquinol methylase